MKIGGLQKVSTIDYPGEIACVVFLWGCNFRCGFCYNLNLVVRECEGSFLESQFFDFLSKRIGKLDGVVITGGEPLVSLEKDFVRKIKDMGFKVKLDTNGSFPEKLQELVDEELIDYIAMDVKSCREDYCKVAGADINISKIEKSIKIVNDFNLKNKKEQGKNKKYGEFRTTVVPGLHDDKKLVEMGEWMGEVCERKPEKIFLQGFKANREGMIDMSFLDKKDVLESELVRLMGEIEGLFGEVGVRV